MIALRAFSFSFAILWRFVIVLPVLVAALMALGVMAFIVSIFAAVLSPIITLLIIGAFGIGASAVPMLVGMRLGMQAEGVRPSNTYVGVMINAIGYGFFMAVCFAVILGLAGALITFISPASGDDLVTAAGQGEEAVWDTVNAAAPLLGLWIMAVAGLLYMSLQAALLPSFAGASIGADPNGRAHTPFYAFGHRFLQLLVVVILGNVGLVIAIPTVVIAFELLGYGEALSASLAAIDMTSTDRMVEAISLELVAFCVIGLVTYLWFFSLICAGGVLSFRELQWELHEGQQAFDASMEERLKGPDEPMRDVDMMELMRSRMPDRKY